MLTRATLTTLAAQISSSSEVIKSYCEEHGHPFRSFDRDAPAVLLPSNAPEHVKSAQQTLLEASWDIQQLATDSSELLRGQAVQYQQLSCLRWLCHFRILSFVPLKGSITYHEVAEAAGVPEIQLRSIARMIMTCNILYEPTPGRLSHNSTSAYFMANSSLLDWATYMTDTSAPTAVKMTEATETWGITDAKNQTAYNLAMATELPFFDHISTSPELNKQFAGYMKNVIASEGISTKHLMRGFDWAALGEAIIVDVGGSSGHVSIDLAFAFPNLNFIVQDLPETIASSQSNLASLPASVASRISYQAHNFFSPQPVKDADVYLLRMILHDWPTAAAMSILQNLAAAIPPKGRIVIMDTVLPLPGTVPRIQEAMLRVRDLTMMQAFNSKERELSDWVELLSQADARLEIKSLVQPFGSLMSIMDVVRTEQKVNGMSVQTSSGVSIDDS